MTEVVDARSAFNGPHGTVAPNDPIRHAVTADHARIRDLINEYSRVYRLLKNDFDTLGYGAHLYEISRQIKDAFHQLESSLKNVLINEMTASGCLTTEAGPYKCALRKGAERAQVVNRAELEEWSVKNKRDLFTPQPLKVDLTELGRLLKFGPVPGAILSEGTPTIVMSVRK